MQWSDFVRIVRHEGLKRFLARSLASAEPVLALRNRLMYWRRMGQPFTFVGLMLSRECHANCIFCPVPTKLKASGDVRFMTMAVAEKAASDLRQIGFSDEINFGENGDALLNPEFKRIVGHFSSTLPLARLTLYTNMMHLDEEMARFLLAARLSRLVLNMDGATATTYRLSKPGLDFETVRRNLHSFIAVRNSTGSDCSVNVSVIAPRRYVELRRDNKPAGVPYDAPEVLAYWRPYLSSRDTISEPVWLFNWNTGVNGIRQTSCPPIMFSEVLSNLFIACDGRAYLCCMDYNTNLSYGNIMDDFVGDLWNSSRRRQLVKAISQNRYSSVGSPCVCCQERYDYMRCYANLLKHRDGDE